MDTFSRMLVAIDGSTTADAAIEAALRLAAGQKETTIRFVTAFERARLIAEYASAMTFVGSDVFDSLQDAASAVLQAALERTTAADVSASGIVREGDPVVEILAEARACNASCIIMGTHGRSGVARALLGSITEETLRATRYPVLVVRANQPQPSGAKAVDRILCAFDDSPPSRAAYDAALALACRRGAELDILSVIPIDADVAEAYERHHRDPGGVTEFYHRYESQLRPLAAEASAAGVHAAAHVVGAPDIGTTIVQYAIGKDADLIVMGTHGRRGVQRALLGSTAETVLRHSDVPVLILHAAGESSPSRSDDRPSASASRGP
jgi:nucleotide-binding universal stress UspA family protein